MPIYAYILQFSILGVLRKCPPTVKHSGKYDRRTCKKYTADADESTSPMACSTPSNAPAYIYCTHHCP